MCPALGSLFATGYSCSAWPSELIFGVAIGRKIYSPFVVLFLVTLVFVGAYGSLRFSRRARDAAGSAADEEVVGA